MNLKNDVKDWAKILIPDFITGVLAAMIGSKIEKDIDDNKETKEAPHKETAFNLGKNIGEKLSIDRAEFLHEIREINADTNGGLKGILGLFDQLENDDGLIKICNKWYHEAWIIRKLLMIPIKYRASEYLWLNDLYEENPVNFFAILEILNNDEWLQIVKKFKRVFKEKFQPVDDEAKKLASSVEEINKGLRATRDRVKAWAILK